MKPCIENIFDNIPLSQPEELFQTLLTTEHILIERIISRGHASEINDWYDQTQDEWVLLLQGQAQLQFKSQPDLVILNPGDYLFIPAHTLHRIHWTTPTTESLWLAIHTPASLKSA